ncbi:MAG: hypothetical protein ISS72_09170 [Candidatus Brocadiae bacterium]|nr:hypothetical protein [Candidatus Brocadiia bacterium]
MTGQPARVVLDGVPRVGFYFDQMKHDDSKMRCPEDVPLPSCLRACLEYLGDGIGCRKIGQSSAQWQQGCAYAYLMGTTGAAFRLSWKPGWHPDNCASWLVSDDPSEVFRRGFASVGYECEIVCRAELRKQGRDNEELLRGKIVESIGQGRPVIAHGVVGPPEECIIAGYDEGGDVLIGWSFFQGFAECNAGVEFEPNGMFRKRDWLDDLSSLVLIGDKGEPPDLKQAYREALAWALDVIRTPARCGDRHNGLAAYDAWADHLLRDDDFATDDLAVLDERFMAHDDAVSAVAEGRWYASIFLSHAAMDGGLKAPELYAAASCFAAEHDLMWKVWGCVGGLGRDEAKTRKLADPDVRRQIVPIVHQARDLDARAANHIERALAK